MRLHIDTRGLKLMIYLSCPDKILLYWLHANLSYSAQGTVTGKRIASLTLLLHADSPMPSQKHDSAFHLEGSLFFQQEQEHYKNRFLSKLFALNVCNLEPITCISSENLTS